MVTNYSDLESTRKVIATMRISDASKRYTDKMSQQITRDFTKASYQHALKLRDETFTPVDRLQLRDSHHLQLETQKARMYAGQGSGDQQRVDISTMSAKNIRVHLGTIMTHLTRLLRKNSLTTEDVENVSIQHYDIIMEFANEKDMMAIYAHMEMFDKGTDAQKAYATRFFTKFGRSSQKLTSEEWNAFTKDVSSAFPKDGNYTLDFRPPSS